MEADVRNRLREFICTELLGRPDYPLGDDEPLITGGLIDSFCLAHIAVFAEMSFGVVIPDVELSAEHLDTLRQLTERIHAGRTP